MSKQGAFLAFVALALAALACAAPPASPTPTPNILLQDDFSNPASGWEIGDYVEGYVGYGDGVYVVISDGDGNSMWGLANRTFDNVQIEVDASQISAPANNNNAYGIGCRIQSNDDGYYMFISGDGYYAITKVVNSEYTNLVDWTRSTAIHEGNATNHIKIVCNGNELILYANDRRLSSITDTDYTSGDITLVVTSFEADPSEIHFDNLIVSAP